MDRLFGAHNMRGFVNVSIRQVSGFFVRAIPLLLGIYLGFTVLTGLFVAPLYDYACKASVQVKSLVLVLPLSLCLIAVLSSEKIQVRLSPFIEERRPLISLAMAFAVVLIQFYLEHACGFTNGWDVEALTARARGIEDLSVYSWYFSRYPNQLFLFGLFCKMTSAARLFDLDPYRVLSICSFLSVDISILLVTSVCGRVFGSFAAVKFQAISSVFIGLSPWVFVPYSDTFGMLFTSLIIWSYVTIGNRYISIFAVTVFAVAGYKVKPTVIFVVLAILAYQCLWLCSNRADSRACFSRKKTKSVVLATSLSSAWRVMLAIGCAGLLALGVVDYVTGEYVPIDDRASADITHYLAMGINPEARGVYSDEENALFSSIQDPAERRQAQLRLWREHLSKLGPSGLIRLLFGKNLTTYADGAFAWKQEGSFFKSVYGNSDFARSIYGINVGESEAQNVSDRSAVFCLVSQAIWVAVLILDSRNCIIWFREGRCQKDGPLGFVVISGFSLLMLSAFLLVFECRARYLFLYSLFYIAIAVSRSTPSLARKKSNCVSIERLCRRCEI